MLNVEDVHYRIGARVLFEGVGFQLANGVKASIVGANGVGKSTLLKIISGDINPDKGQITLGSRQTIGTVGQEIPAIDTTVMDYVLRADKQRTQLLDALDTCEDPMKMAELHDRLNDIGAHRAPSRAGAILAGLGFDNTAQSYPLSHFSGGWRMRVALAACLFTQPDILILDEPSNHLDLEAAVWLETFLQSYPQGILIVSHDRGLLNSVPQETYHLEQGRLSRYKGGYDQFEKTRNTQLSLLSAKREKQQVQVREIQDFADRFRATASKAKQVQSRLKMLDKMEPIASVVESKTANFHFPKPDIIPPPLITFEDVSWHYGADEKRIFDHLNLTIGMDEKIALLGANGNGKTTLLKLMAGALAPQDGSIRRPNKLKIGYFDQDQVQLLQNDQTPLDVLKQKKPLETEQKLRNHLGQFGFGTQGAVQATSTFSGGERARLAFAIICLDKPHMLLLDEPTNHLDIDSRQVLIQALNAYEGTLIIVSHDPHLINSCCDNLYLVADGKYQAFEGDLKDYRQYLAQQRRALTTRKKKVKKVKETDKQASQKVEATSNTSSKTSHASSKTSHVTPKTLNKKQLEKRMAQLEVQMDSVGGKITEIEKVLQEGSVYQNAPEQASVLTQALKRLVAAREKTEEVWCEVSATLDKIKKG